MGKAFDEGMGYQRHVTAVRAFFQILCLTRWKPSKKNNKRKGEPVKQTGSHSISFSSRITNMSLRTFTSRFVRAYTPARVAPFAFTRAIASKSLSNLVKLLPIHFLTYSSF
jgi:hypothetical protein